MKTIHYVFYGSVVRVETDDGLSQVGSRIGPDIRKMGRKLHEVANVTVKDKDLQALLKKAQDHLGLVDDDPTIPAGEDHHGKRNVG